MVAKILNLFSTTTLKFIDFAKLCQGHKVPPALTFDLFPLLILVARLSSRLNGRYFLPTRLLILKKDNLPTDMNVVLGMGGVITS